MIDRRIESTLRHRLSSVVPAAVLLGPRQVGKTTLSLQFLKPLFAVECKTGEKSLKLIE
jgi:predicted AAA+ superfamily ATPase